MRVSEILKSSLATLKMNGRRTFLTLIGIVIGIAAVITILSLGKGFEKQTLDSLAKDEKGRRSQSFYYNMSGSDTDPETLQPFSEDNLEHIRSFPGVDEVQLDGQDVTEQYMQISFRKTQEYMNVSLKEETNFDLVVGRNLNSSDSKAKKPYVIIEEMAASMFFASPQEAYHKAINLDGQDYTIVGVYQMPMDQEQDNIMEWMADPIQLAIPKATYERFSQQSTFNFSIKVFYRDDADMKGTNKRIAEYLKESGKAKDSGSYEYYDRTEEMAEISKQLTMITLFITSIAGISLFIAGVGVMNMMYISVSERTKEIGIRRSVGATRFSIQWQFLLEGIVITTFGGLIGYVLGFIIAKIAGNFLPFKPAYDLLTAFVTVVISVFIGIAAGYLPARQAAHKNLIEILR